MEKAVIAHEAEGSALPETPVTFGALLRKLRGDAELTQEELAEAAGLSPRSVSDLERGSTRLLARTPPGFWPAHSA